MQDLGVLGGLLNTASPERLIPSAVTPDAAAPLTSYLRTRRVEFVVHADDIAASVGLPPPEMDPIASGIAVEALVQMCRERAGDAEVLRALARSERAQPGTLRAL